MNSGENRVNKFEGALKGIRVLDLTRVWAGPLGTRVLGDFGAEVIRIFDPRMYGDIETELSDHLNRNKLSLPLRLDTDKGRRAFLSLVAISDIVVENFTPRVMRNLALTFEDMRLRKRDIILCSISGFGSSGPYSGYPAYGSTAEALSGIPTLIGYGDEIPIQTGISYADPIAGLNMVGTVLTYLRHRNVTGEGQFIDLSLADGPVTLIGEHIGLIGTGVSVPEVNGNKHQIYSPYGAYRCRGTDEWVTICVTDHIQWESLIRAINNVYLSDHKFSDFPLRKQNEQELDAVIAKWTIDKHSEAVMWLLQEAGVPAGMVANSQQLLVDPHLNERDFFVRLPDDVDTIRKYDGQSIHGNIMDKSQWTLPSETFGAAKYILCDLLGYTEEEIDEMKKENVTL